MNDWYVFKSIAADGTWLVGIARGIPDSSAVMVVAQGLTHAEALSAAKQLASDGT